MAGYAVTNCGRIKRYCDVVTIYGHIFKYKKKYLLPYAFTEQGVAMLSGILNSDIAINMNIGIMRAFVAIRKLTIQQMDIKEQLTEIRERFR